MYGVIRVTEIRTADEYISDDELNEAINEWYEEQEAKAEIENDVYPLKGIRSAVCSSSK